MAEREQPPRLDAVNRVRAVQREWIAATRESVAAGGPFAICNGDEAEEIFLAMGIPVLAINYWNFLILAQGNGQHFTGILHQRGYPGRHMFALGLASSLEPGKAPWGGLPKPSIICGSPRSESEMRVTELWARATGAHHFPMEFSFPAEHRDPVPADWWNWTADRWEELIDTPRLDFRVEQERQLIAFLETVTGRSFDVTDLGRAMMLVNEQMRLWAEARRLIAATTPCPVTIRDQMSMYQAMWHRGTETGVALLGDYVAEMRYRVAAGVGGYGRERIRIHFSGDVPKWQAWAEETYGAVTVSNFYSGVPDLYARRIYKGDPLRVLAGRHLFLFALGSEFMAHQAREHRCDVVVAIEPNRHAYAPAPSTDQQIVEAAGLRYVALETNDDTPQIRAELAAVFDTINRP